jgi:hypothetical protein
MQNKMIWIFGFLMLMMYFSSKVASNPEIAAELAKSKPEVQVQKANLILKSFVAQKEVPPERDSDENTSENKKSKKLSDK